MVAELMFIIQNDSKTPKGSKNLSKFYLFPGLSCYPLSPMENNKDDDSSTLIDSEDLLIKIFQILGTQTEQTLTFIEDSNIYDYCKKLMPDKASEQFDKKFSTMSKELRSLLKKMLFMSPDKRLSAKELIKSPYFDSIRNKDQEEDADF